MLTKHKHLSFFIVFLFMIFILFGCGKNPVTQNNISTDNNASNNQGSSNPYNSSVSGTVYMPASFVTTLGLKTNSVSISNNNYPLVGARIRLLDLISNEDITKTITGLDSIKSDANGHFLFPTIDTSNAFIIEASLGGFIFITSLSPVASNASVTLNNLTTMKDCMALQTAYDSIMNIQLSNVSNTYKYQMISNVIDLKKILTFKSTQNNPDNFKATSTPELIRKVALENVSNITINDDLINKVKNFIPLGIIILQQYDTLISSTTYPRLITALSKIFNTDSTETLSTTSLPSNPYQDNICLKFLQYYSGYGSGYSGKGYYGSGYYGSGSGSEEFRIISATEFPNGYVSWKTNVGGCHEFYLYPTQVVSGSGYAFKKHVDIINFSVDDIISTHFLSIGSGDHPIQTGPGLSGFSGNTLYLIIYQYMSGSIDLDPSGTLGTRTSASPIQVSSGGLNMWYSGSGYYSGSGSGYSGLYISGAQSIDAGNSFYLYTSYGGVNCYDLFAFADSGRSGSSLARQHFDVGPGLHSGTYSGLVSSGLQGHSGVYLFLYKLSNPGQGYSSGYYVDVNAYVNISGLTGGAFLSGGNYYCPKGDSFTVVANSSQRYKLFELYDTTGQLITSSSGYYDMTSWLFNTAFSGYGTYYVRVKPSGFNNWYAERSINVYNPFNSSGFNYVFGAIYQGMDTRGVAVDPSGYIYSTHYTGNKVIKFNPSGYYSNFWGSFGTGSGQFNGPAGIAIDSSGYIYVVDKGNNRIQKFNSSGTCISIISGLSSPEGIAVDSAGNIYVTEPTGGCVKKFNSAGSRVFTLTGIYNAMGIAVDSSQYIYISIYNTENEVEIYNSSGSYVGSFWCSGTGHPWGIAIDSVHNFYVTVTTVSGGAGCNYVQKYNPSGTFVTQWNGAQLNDPKGVAVDSIGYVYVSDNPYSPSNHNVYKLRPMP